MKIARLPHRWSVTPKEAIAIQRRLASRVITRPPRRRIRLIAGVDAAFSEDRRSAVAGVVLWDLARREVVEERVATRRLTFPYVPGLLTFREAPAILAALRKLVRPPDAILCDGQGYAHPRRFGLACHIGILCDLPAIGCGKSRLLGEHRSPAAARGSRVDLVDRGEVIGSVLRTQRAVKPVYVSLGHRMDLRRAEELVLAAATRFRLPEPTRLADQLVSRVKRNGVGLRLA